MYNSKSLFDRAQLTLKPLRERRHLLNINCIKKIEPVPVSYSDLKTVAKNIKSANREGRAVVLMMGAHVIRSGVQRYIIDLMNRGIITCVAMNGAGVIHDFEFAMIGATTESVAEYIRNGQFGLWQETGLINDIVAKAAENELGIGESVGKFIEEQNLPNKRISILAAAYRSGCPITVHVSIGCDITHEHPNFDGAAYGKTSEIDFLKYTRILEYLEGGVIMNFGSAVMAPEIFLKALSMVRNVARNQGRKVCRFTTLVCDLINLPSNYHQEAERENSKYYFRPWKTMLIRTVADGGESYYVQGEHSKTVPQLWTALN